MNDRERYPVDNGEIIEAPDHDRADLLARMYLSIDADIDRLKALKAKTLAELATMIGPNEGITGPWGSVHYPSHPGRIAWKQIVEGLVVTRTAFVNLTEAHRGPPYRIPRVTLKRQGESK